MASTIDKIRDYRNRRKSDDINSETINRIRQYRAQKAESEVNSLIEKYNEDNKTLSSLQLSDESSYNSFRDKLENQQKNMSRLNYLLDTHGAFYDNEFTKSLRRSLDSSKTAYDGAIKLFDTYKTYDDYARATASSDDWKAKRDEVQSRLDLIEDNAPDKSKDWANLSRSERIRRMDEYQNNLDGKGKQLSELWDEYNTYYHQALQVETAQKLKDAALNAEDFKKYSDIGAGIENPTMQEAEGYFLQIGKKKFGAKPIGNIVTYSRENSGEIKARSREDGTVYGNYLYSHLTDDETAAYNYYLAKDIENGTNLSDEYLKEMQYTLNAREGAALAENLEDKEALKYVFALAYAGPDQWASGIKGFISQIKGSDDYIAPSPVQFASPAVRESIESQFGRGAYDLSVTVGNQIPNILISSAFGKMAGLTTMGASASGNAYAEMINNGYDKGQANAYAALTGLSETTLQYLLGGISSLGGLTDDVLSGAIDNVVRGMNRANLQIAAKYGMKLGASMLSEGFEEGLQEVLDPIFKNAVLGTHENVNWGDVAYSAVLGALSAGVLEGAGTSVEAADTFVQSERVSKAMNTDGFTDTVKNVGVTYAADTVSYKLASKIDENSTSYDVLELLRAEGAELSEQNRAQLKTSMTESGISSKDAEIILNYASGFLSDDVKLTENMIYGLNIAEPFADALRQLVKENTPLNQTVSQITERTEQYGDLIERVKSSKGTKSITEAIDEESSVLTQQALTELPDTEISRNTAENQKVAKTDTQSDKDTLPRVKRITEITKNVGSDGSVRFIPHVELEDGNTASGAHEYNSDDAQLVEAISGMGYDIQTANAVFSMARANNIPAARADDMTLIYELGYQHAPDSAFELISSFAPAQVEYLRRLGESARSKRNSTVKGGAETIERSGGKIIDDTDGSAQANELKNLRREQLDYIRALTAVVGGKVHIFNSVKDESGNFVAAKTLAEGRVAKKGEKAPNGAFDSVTGDIYIDLNAGNYGEGLMMYALAHEYTHSIRMYNTDMFDRLSDFIIEEMYGKNINVNELVHERMEKAGLDFDTAFEEVISDSLEEMLVSENAAQHLKNLYKSDKSLYSRLVDKIRQLLQAFKKVFEQYKNRSDAGLSQEARILREISRAEYDKLSQLYAQALKGMSQTDEQNNGTKKLSENKNIKTSPAREGQSFSPKSSGGALINDDNLSQRKQLVNGSSALDEDTALYSIRYTEDNQPVAVIDKNILADVPKSRWVKTIKRMLTEKFRGGVPISGRLIKINYITRSEYTNSKYSRYLRDNDVEKYNDKLKSANNIDDVVLASTNYVNEDLKHARKDNFKEFARGSVLIKIGDKSYTAKVIVGFTSGGEMVLYDIIDFNLTDLKLKKDTPYDQTLSKIVRSGMSSDNTVSQKDQSVNSNYTRESADNTETDDIVLKGSDGKTVRFSDRIDFSQQVDNVLKNTHDKNNHVYLGQTPVRLREILGIKNLPMLMTGSHVYSICVSQERAEKDGRLNNKLHYHDLGEKTVKKLPAALNEPVLIIKSDNDDANLNFVVVTRLSDKKGNPVIVAIKPDGKGNYMDMRIDSTVALSAYGRSNIMSYIARARQEDRILYADKKYNRQKHNPPGAQFTNDIMSADYYRQHNSPGAQFTNEIMTADYDKSLSHYKALVNSNYMQNSLENSLENMDRQKNSGYNESDYNRGTDVDEAELKAQLRETKFSSRTSETEENPLGFESRAEPVKNSSINWVYKAKIFSQAENRLFHQKIAEIRSGDRSFEKNADGEYMLPIANKIVFTNGDWEAPYIRQIIEVFTAYGDEFEEIKEIIFNVEKGKSRKSEAVRAFEDLQIAGRTYVYTDKNDGVYAWEDGKRSGRTRREANRNYINKLYRERNGFKSEDAAREYARLYELYNGVKLSSRDYGNRYIEESPAVQQAAEDENAKLREEISYLKELVKIQGKLTHGQKFTRSSVKIALNKIIRDAGLDISADRAPAVQMLNSLYEYVAAGDNLNWQSLRGHAQPLIDWINEHDRRKNDDISESEHRYTAAERESLLFESIYENYWAVTTLHTVADKYQGRINRLKANHRQKMAEITALHRERIDTLRRESRERLDKKTAELNMRHRESLERSRRERKKTELRHKILRRVNQLNKLLLHGDKEHHVPRSLSKPTAEILSTVNMDTVNAQKRLAKLRERIEKATDPAVIARLNAAYTRVEEQGYNIARRLEVLDRAYDELKNSDSSVSVAYDRNISDMITELKEQVGNTPLREMTLEQLEKTDSVYKMVLHIIRTANKTFKEQRQATVEQLGREVMTQIYATGGSKKYSIKALDSLKKFTWLNAKPVYAMRAIGSKTLEQLFDNVRAGEDVWAVDVSEAREYFLDKVKKYGYRTWDFKRRYDFQSVSGREFSLSLGEIMSLYAYSKRPQAHDHLSKGGFVLDSSVEVEKKVGGVPVKYKVNTADAYNITDEIMSDIISTLSSEQRKFADDMQRYLSDVMGQKGNEVSRVMYDIDMFTEKNYFPLRSAKQYLYEQNETVGEVRVKNSGFTKKTVPSANNPIILKNFTDVWAEHVDAMSMYHAFVLPLEDFNRVFNYKTPSTQMSDTKSVKTALQNAYGRHAADYIKQMLVDLNGGATSQQGTEISNKLISLFKKGAVFASASVVIQQPSAIARAMAYIDPKYFASALPSSMNFKNHTADWNEIKKYAPVAIIKEMGYFDTNVGKRTVDWITASEYVGFSQKARALVTDSGFRDEVLSRAPAIADEAAWVHIWNAVKREQQSNGGAITDGEFLIRCGKRFTEVVVNTQVYDSVLSRSALMRSKDTGVKMATSFMAEPATSLNMLADAIIQVRRGGKSAVKSASQQVGAVVASMILNSILVAFVYGARDEEDESYLERYKKALVGSLADNLNPLNLVPYINDIVSIAQGYDVERSDMSIVSDLWSAFEKLGNDNVPPYKKAEDFAGSVAALFGLPLKNIMRDTRAIWNNTAGVIDPTLKMRSGSTSNTYQTALYNAVRDGNGDITDKIIEISVTDRIEEKTQEYVLSGKDRKEAEKIAESSVRASFTVYWKPLYLEAYNKNDTEQTAVIRRLLNETGLYEDIVQTCSNWVKSPKE